MWGCRLNNLKFIFIPFSNFLHPSFLRTALAMVRIRYGSKKNTPGIVSGGFLPETVLRKLLELRMMFSLLSIYGRLRYFHLYILRLRYFHLYYILRLDHLASGLPDLFWVWPR
jgi:hypothetical protein